MRAQTSIYVACSDFATLRIIFWCNAHYHGRLCSRRDPNCIRGLRQIPSPADSDARAHRDIGLARTKPSLGPVGNRFTLDFTTAAFARGGVPRRKGSGSRGILGSAAIGRPRAHSRLRPTTTPASSAG